MPGCYYINNRQDFRPRWGIFLIGGVNTLNSVVVKAHAKINLTLDVNNRRPDGYHNISSVMQSVSLADTLHVHKCASDVRLTTNIPILPESDNIATKAAKLFFRELKIAGGVCIELKKTIPIAAGLAGGSADAAGVLHALNRLYETNLTEAELQELALVLGADVPFCLQGGTMLAEGVGNELTKLTSLPDYPVVIIKPLAAISTQEVYQSLTAEMFNHTHTAQFMDAQHRGSNVFCHMKNVMEAVTINIVPEVASWKRRLREAGALVSLMSGSGPSIFGLFSTDEAADAVAAKWANEVWIVKTKFVNAGISEPVNWRTKL